MEKQFEIYFKDLNKDAQRRFLKFLGITQDDGNFEVAPLTIIYVEEDASHVK
ncbi:MAG TPA: hypothetical protein PLL26_02725 [Candidatus Dojkabacteria bacterium]|nr:hypothetical protein [Candidatus Dojkabacteria bacterium]